MTLVVGTAGHIDHGKTTLLRALTGIDADRLPEEQRRGMTIDVGYAHLVLPDGSTIDFVDVPGHDRLIGNMLVGAGEIDAVLLVVAADDGARAQTVEHLELLDALGLSLGVVAITKTDAVEPARVAAVVEEMRRLIGHTRLHGAPILAVSGTTGERVAELRDALAALRPGARRPAGAGPRLAIDRAFSVRGRGVVVTGTLRGGPVARGDVLVVAPGAGEARIREVQVHGRPVDRSEGGRTALNLGGIELARLRRGQIVAASGAVEATDRLLVTLRPPAPLRPGAVPALPADRSRVRLHVGTDQVDVRVGRSGRESVELGDSGIITAILRLDRPVAVTTGDPFVLRRPSPGTTLAGGTVVDPAPSVGVSRRRATPERVAALVAAVAEDDRGDARLALHGALAGAEGRPPRLAPDVAAELQAAALDVVTAHHREHPTAPGILLGDLRSALVRHLRKRVSVDRPAAERLAAQIVEVLTFDGRLRREAERVRLPWHEAARPSPAEIAAAERLLTALDAAAPPSLAEAVRAAGCSAEMVRRLERDGRLVRVDTDLAWATPAWERLARLALDAAARAPLTPAALRDATGTSRKYVMALLEDLNRRGVLARTPAGHVPGPRAGRLEPRPVA